MSDGHVQPIAEFLQRDDGQIPAAGAHQAVHRGGSNPGTVGQLVVANIAFSANLLQPKNDGVFD